MCTLGEGGGEQENPPIIDNKSCCFTRWWEKNPPLVHIIYKRRGHTKSITSEKPETYSTNKGALLNLYNIILSTSLALGGTKIWTEGT